ncbi:hypothetical protein HMPREF1639_06355 [Peptostreptococcus sp. MV1]|uniref:hypothetical protein n=1 Tax=Peptostreptococcus sp. MV1 TaxID=1219626 RepID=UPI00050FCF53|nr:hypothetical protein [Peptostreptococcus sp. MV1]KGF12241.1 hypothetical protein HMPREF1639_06355 [Peptostreptococcus sp. MV1]
MSISGLVILIILSLLVVLFVIGKDGRGVNNYIVRNTAAVYSLILSLLAIIKSNQGMVQGFYMGLLSFILSLLVLTVYKKKYDICRILLVISIVLATIATYFSYIN